MTDFPFSVAEPNIKNSFFSNSFTVLLIFVDSIYEWHFRQSEKEMRYGINTYAKTYVHAVQSSGYEEYFESQKKITEIIDKQTKSVN